MSKKYEVAGDFLITFPLDNHKDTYEEVSFLQNIIKIALEKDYIEVKRINVRVIKEEKK